MATLDYFPSLKGYYEKVGISTFQRFNFGDYPGTLRLVYEDYYEQW